MSEQAPRTIAFLIPGWSLIAAGLDPDAPAATFASGRIQSSTVVARQAGVRRGQRLRDAQRRCPSLELAAADPRRDAREFEPIVLALEAATPGIEVVRAGLVLVRAAGPARYFGGEQAAAQLLRDVVTDVDLDQADGPVGAGAGVADGGFCAALAAASDTLVPAGHSAAFLARFGLDVLGRPDLAAVLRRLGVRTLGDLSALPRAAVIARFGAEGLRAHRLASGQDPRPPSPRLPPADLAVSMPIDPPVISVEPLAFIAKALAEHLHQRLADAGLVCERVEIAAFLADGTESRRWWRHDGELSALALAERARWQLGQWLNADGAGRTTPDQAHDDGELCGFVRLTLQPDGLRAATGLQLALLGPEPLPDRAGAAVERLQHLLGHQAVTRPQLRGGRDPHTRVARIAFGDLAPEAPGAGPWPGHIPDPPPAQVLLDPISADLLDAAGVRVAVSAQGEMSGDPAWLCAFGQRDEVTGFSRPWIAVERVWDPATATRRARLQVVTRTGRAFLLALEHGAWSITAGYQ